MGTFGITSSELRLVQGGFIHRQWHLLESLTISCSMPVNVIIAMHFYPFFVLCDTCRVRLSWKTRCRHFPCGSSWEIRQGCSQRRCAGERGPHGQRRLDCRHMIKMARYRWVLDFGPVMKSRDTSFRGYSNGVKDHCCSSHVGMIEIFFLECRH